MEDEATPSETPAGILRRVNKLSTAIALLSAHIATADGLAWEAIYTQQVELQGLKARRKKLQALLPPLRLVHSQ